MLEQAITLTLLARHIPYGRRREDRGATLPPQGSNEPIRLRVDPMWNSVPSGIKQTFGTQASNPVPNRLKSTAISLRGACRSVRVLAAKVCVYQTHLIQQKPRTLHITSLHFTSGGVNKKIQSRRVQPQYPLVPDR